LNKDIHKRQSHTFDCQKCGFCFSQRNSWQYTGQLCQFQESSFVYTGTITLGATTPSFDLEMEVDKTFDTDHISPEMIAEQAKKMLGEQLQTPPTYSAKKIDGKRAFNYAREGKTVEMRRNLIEIHKFEVDSSDFPKIKFEIECGKGTYIRSIAHDFGKALNSGAHLSELRRTKNGNLSVDSAWTVDHAIEQITELEPLPKPAG